MDRSKIDATLSNLMAKVDSLLKDASELKINTRYYDLGADGSIENAESGSPLVCTRIGIDGDNTTVLPMHKTGDGNVFRLDQVPWEIHQKNVEVAIAYRQHMLELVLGFLKSAIPGKPEI